MHFLGELMPRAHRHALARPGRRVLASGVVAGVGLSLLAGVGPASADDGSYTLAPGKTVYKELAQNWADGSSTATIKVPTKLTATMFGAVQVRSADGNGYRAKVRFGTDGSLDEQLIRVNNGAETRLTGLSLDRTVVAGDKVAVETSVSGTNPVTVKMRTWVVGSTVPAWQVS